MRSTMSRLLLAAAGVAAISFAPSREAAAQSFRREGRIVGRETRREGRADARAYGNYGNYGYNNGYNGYGYNNYGPGGYYGPGNYGPAGYGPGYAGGGYARGGYGGPGGYAGAGFASPGYGLPGSGGLGYGGLGYGGMGYGGMGYGGMGYGGRGYGGQGYGNAGGYGPGAYGGQGYGAGPAYGNNFANNNPPPAPRQRGYLGVTMSETPDGIVRVKNVRPGSPAQEAGLRPGDEILAINDREVYSYRDVTRMIGRHDPGDVVKIDVDRNGQDRNIEVELGEQNGQMAGNFGGQSQGPMFNEPYGGQQFGGGPGYGPNYGGPVNEGPGYGNSARPRTARQATRQRNQSLDPNLYEQNGY